MNGIDMIRNGNTAYSKSPCDSCQNCKNRIPIFNLLTNEELEILNKDRYSVHFRKDETILKQGITSSHIISLIEGFAKVYTEGKSSKNLLLRLLKPLTLIDEIGDVNQFTIIALSDVDVCFISVENFTKVLERNNRFAFEILNHRAKNVEFYLRKLKSLVQKNAPGRIADGLLYLANDVYMSSRFVLTLSKKDIAELTYMSIDSVIRNLKDLENEKIIAFEGNKVNILDLHKLVRISYSG